VIAHSLRLALAQSLRSALFVVGPLALAFGCRERPEGGAASANGLAEQQRCLDTLSQAGGCRGSA
jgi:hypothetical protein